MAVIGKIELQTEQDVRAGTETRLMDVFPFAERSKQFVADQPVKRDETRLKIHIQKFGALDTISDANLPRGFNTSLATLMK